MRRISLLATLIWLASCSSPGSSSAEGTDDGPQLDRRTQIRLNQYKIEGAKIYVAHCVNCHQVDGKGLGSLYPPLAGSDYLLTDLPRAACVIKNGQSGEVTVNGITYNQAMPQFKLTNLEIAEVLTFIGNSWGNQAGLTPVKDVEKWLKACDGLTHSEEISTE